MSAASTSVLVVDDHAVFADTLSLALDSHPGTSCAGVARSAGEAVAVAAATDFDVAIVDYQLPDGTGLSIIGELLDHRPDARVMMLTAHPRPDLADRALAEGAVAFLAKESSLSDILTAIRTSTAEQPTVTVHADPAGLVDSGLTKREHEVLVLLGQGLDAHRIARRLSLSVYTVRDYIKALLAKLQSRTQLEAVVNAARRGLIHLDPP